MRRARAICRAVGLLAAAGAVGCGSDPVEAPLPPDVAETAAIVAAYETPSGSIDRAELAEVAARVRGRLEDLQLDGPAKLMAAALTRLRQRFADGGVPVDPAATEDTDRARLRAVARVTRTCPGFHDAPPTPDAEQNGRVELTATVREGELGRYLWGRATACRSWIDPSETSILSEPLDFVIDGTLHVYLYAPLPRTPRDASFLLRFAGEIGGRQSVHSIDFDVRLMNLVLEFRHGVGDGHIVVAVGLDEFTLRAKNGSFRCSLRSLACS